MNNIFNRQPDPKEVMRQNNRELRKTNRDLESDRRALDRREKELENEIKKLAKSGQKEACAVLAKQLLQLRKQRTKSVGMSAHVSQISAQNTASYSMGRMVNAMGQTASSMKQINKAMPVEKISQNMREFQMAQSNMEMSEEMMNDALDSMFSAEGDDAEQDAIVNQVLDEIGIDTNAKLANVPQVSRSIPAAEATATTTDADLERLLAQLRQ